MTIQSKTTSQLRHQILAEIRPRVGLSVNNKQKVRQAMVKISRGGGGGAMLAEMA